jgi:hypothetical protein
MVLISKYPAGILPSFLEIEADGDECSFPPVARKVLTRKNTICSMIGSKDNNIWVKFIQFRRGK